ncbi:hypothetical protein WG899_08505 [Paucibacter sp. AS339]|uniref:hypothetical protein n=1 Tax=Paucibacter hankyongi TaxID=3133434 RepID=UPI0030A7ABDB
MHLMIPYASATGDAAAHTLAELPLPHLSELLALLRADGSALGSDEFSFNTPYELALADLRACRAEAGCLPTAAWASTAPEGPGDRAWARLTPIHLAVGSDQITALPPESLSLSEAESQQFFDSLAELWPADEGWQARWQGSNCWLIAHPSLAGLASASLDRVLHRHVDSWMPSARRLRTLQNEIQMLLHGLPLNHERESRGALPLNSVWISGCGVDSGSKPLPKDLHIDECLREPLLAGDWQSWSRAWVQLDAGPVAQLLAQVQAGGQEPLTLTLCGERLSQTWRSQPRPRLQALWQRWLPPRANTATLLGAL